MWMKANTHILTYLHFYATGYTWSYFWVFGLWSLLISSTKSVNCICVEITPEALQWSTCRNHVVLTLDPLPIRFSVTTKVLNPMASFLTQDLPLLTSELIPREVHPKNSERLSNCNVNAVNSASKMLQIIMWCLFGFILWLWRLL